MKRSLRIAATAFLALGLSACSTFDKMFTSDDLPPLQGERISILQLQKELTPNPALEQTPVVLPEAWVNRLWPQSGGYPTHAMGHLGLGGELKKAWSSSIGSGGGERAPITARPVVADDKVYTLDTQGNVTAFDLAKGGKLWRVQILPKDEDDTGAVGGGLAFDSGTLYVTVGHKLLTALDAADGKLRWKVDTPSPGRSAPTIMEGRVYLITLDNRLLVYDAANGGLLWKYTGVSETTNLLGSASAAVDPNLVVLPLSSGELYGLNPADGNVLWQDSLSAVRRTGSMTSISDIRGLPVIDQGIVYAVSFSGRMVAIEAATGQRIWQREIGSSETPWPAGDAVFVLTADQQLAAFQRLTGETHWVTALPRDDGQIWSGPVLAGGRLLVISNKGDLAELDPATGKLLRKSDMTGASLLPPIVAGNTLLVLDAGGSLTAFR